jgi:signal transduction histidine kinase
VRVLVIGEEAEVRFEVRNSGPPIDPEVLKQMFDPLNRGLRESNHNDEGSLGLGLYIAREIVKAHGGEITVRREGTETVFAVRLPRS